MLSNWEWGEIYVFRVTFGLFPFSPSTTHLSESLDRFSLSMAYATHIIIQMIVRKQNLGGVHFRGDFFPNSLLGNRDFPS